MAGMGKLRGKSSGAYRTSTAAAGFVAGVAVTLMLFASHQKHSEAHLEASNKQLPGQLAKGEDELSVSIAATAQLAKASNGTQGGGWLRAARPPPPPLPPPAKQPPPNLDKVQHLMVSFGNSAYFELVQNWARSVMQTGSQFIIAAFDDEMMGQCGAQGLPCVRVDMGANATNFRSDFAAFRKMGAVKIQFVLGLLEQHPNLEYALVSDSDCVWIRDPWQYLTTRGTADFFISSDCLSVKLEDEWQPNHNQPRCGHIPGNSYGRAFNTGLFAARNTPASRALLKAWADMLLDTRQEKLFDANGNGIDDQLALNMLFDLGGIAGVGPEEPRLILAFNRTLKVQPLPVSLFSNGHVAFVQRTPWRLGVTPMVVHATFQRYAGHGKKSRMREMGLWHVDPPEYYGAVPQGQEGPALARNASGAFALKLLAYDGNREVLAFVEEQERLRYGGKGHGMPLLEKHWVGMSYQMAALRDALAAGRILGRTVVVPTIWCWCDYDESIDILESCRIKGSDLQVPFECPLDFLVPIPSLDASGLPYRQAGFLKDPRVPATLRQSQAAVQIIEGRPANPFPKPSHTMGHGVTVWQGILQSELLQAVEPVKDEAVLQLRGRVPGFLGGFDDPATSSAFDAKFREAMNDWGNTPFWCCMTWGRTDQQYRYLRYQMPRPLGEGWVRWQPPVMQLPDWCDKVSSNHDNDKFVHYPQHPCEFLSNATSAARAAQANNPPLEPSTAAAIAAALGSTR